MKQASTSLKERTGLPTVCSGRTVRTVRPAGKAADAFSTTWWTNRTYGSPARPLCQNGALAPFWRQGGQRSMATPVVDQSSTSRRLELPPPYAVPTLVCTYVHRYVRSAQAGVEAPVQPYAGNWSTVYRLEKTKSFVLVLF